jgi:hypothetical protein
MCSIFWAMANLELFCPRRLADLLLLNTPGLILYTQKDNVPLFKSLNYVVTWVDVAVLKFCLNSNFCVLSLCQMSFNKQRECFLGGIRYHNILSISSPASPEFDAVVELFLKRN